MGEPFFVVAKDHICTTVRFTSFLTYPFHSGEGVAGWAPGFAPDGQGEADRRAGGRVSPVRCQARAGLRCLPRAAAAGADPLLQQGEPTMAPIDLLTFSLQVLNDKKEFDVRQQEALNRLVKRQEQETFSLQARIICINHCYNYDHDNHWYKHDHVGK